MNFLSLKEPPFTWGWLRACIASLVLTIHTVCYIVHQYSLLFLRRELLVWNDNALIMSSRFWYSVGPCTIAPFHRHFVPTASTDGSLQHSFSAAVQTGTATHAYLLTNFQNAVFYTHLCTYLLSRHKNRLNRLKQREKNYWETERKFQWLKTVL